MGMSMDYGQMESLAKFSFFLDAISDPKGLKIALEQAQAIVDEEKKLQGPRAIVAGADAYAKKVKADIAKEDDALTARIVAFEEMVKTREKNGQREEQRLVDLQREVSAKMSEADAYVKEQKILLASLKTRDQLLIENLAAVARERGEVQAEKELLSDRAQKLQALMGA